MFRDAQQHAGGYIAADHLFSSGMRHRHHLRSGQQDERQPEVKGYLQRLKELQLEEPREYYFGEYDFQHGYDAMMQILEKNKRVDGVFAENDYLAAGAINALLDKGLSVPKDIKVIGFDNRDFRVLETSHHNVPATVAGDGHAGNERAPLDDRPRQCSDKLYVLEPRLITGFSTTGVAS